MSAAIVVYTHFLAEPQTSLGAEASEIAKRTPGQLRPWARDAAASAALRRAGKGHLRQQHRISRRYVGEKVRKHQRSAIRQCIGRLDLVPAVALTRGFAHSGHFDFAARP